jgi:CRISPR-associated protein Csx3
MGKYFSCTLLENDVLKIGFGEPAQNDVIVADAKAALEDLNLEGGSLIRVNGPASLPVAMMISHEISHKYGAIACFDPKLGKYVVAISHSPEYTLGQLID